MATAKNLGDVRAVRTAMEADIRATLLMAAATLLSEEGPAALTVRRVADSVNGTSKMIYTHFGGKDGLMEALYLHAFNRFTRVLEAENAEKAPLIRLYRMIAAYRDFALTAPALYNVMFGDLGRNWEPSLECRRQAWNSFSTLRKAVQLNLPDTRQKESTRATYALWAAMHGVISLELRKLIASGLGGEELFTLAVDSVLNLHDIPVMTRTGW